MFACLIASLFVCPFVCLFDCFFVCLSVCPFVCLFDCFFVCLFICLFVCLFDMCLNCFRWYPVDFGLLLLRTTRLSRFSYLHHISTVVLPIHNLSAVKQQT